MEDTMKFMPPPLPLDVENATKADGLEGLEALVVMGVPGVSCTTTPLCDAVTVKAVGEMVARTVMV